MRLFDFVIFHWINLFISKFRWNFVSFYSIGFDRIEQNHWNRSIWNIISIRYSSLFYRFGFDFDDFCFWLDLFSTSTFIRRFFLGSFHFNSIKIRWLTFLIDLDFRFNIKRHFVDSFDRLSNINFTEIRSIVDSFIKRISIKNVEFTRLFSRKIFVLWNWIENRL